MSSYEFHKNSCYKQKCNIHVKPSISMISKIAKLAKANKNKQVMNVKQS